MLRLPSYVKDTTDFINKLRNIKLQSKNTYLVTLDVSSLYTNIPHTDGTDACLYYLRQGNNNSRLSSDEIVKLLKLILENNYFKFGDDYFLQKMGTAMGSPVAPAYAALFMGKFEEEFLKDSQLKPSLWLRFLDDIFMLWDHSLEELNTFIDKINNVHPSIKFTHTISQQSVSFLDVQVSKGKSYELQTNVYVKETNNHQYLDYTSCHPKRCKDGIPHSQAKRYRRIISDDDVFSTSLSKLREFFISRNFPETVIDSAFLHVSQMSQEDALRPQDKEKKNVLPFIVTYNPSLPNIGNTIHKYWDLLNLSKNEGVKNIHNNYTPIIAYKRPRNLQDFLVRSRFDTDSDFTSHSGGCCRKRCSHCVRINSDLRQLVFGITHIMHDNVLASKV
ncbi:uncharacterized protein LOC132736432 [Ruditapes philippinarum]|uniref:uncharacterized protein LOC132736432 n=1 Tax=Ruditapes philippinarum TaxID=129788 RepID=UPI00295BD643|nr:uncharacterized protein LOC132736432 [Ruditapes philippinarum]